MTLSKLVGLFVHAPRLPVSAFPSWAVPAIDGRDVFAGLAAAGEGRAATIAVGGENALVRPPAFLASTWSRMVCPMSTGVAT